MSSNEDESICPLCQGTTYVGETISCETCDLWFHFACVGVTRADPVVQRKDLPFYCPKCDSRNNKKPPPPSSSSSSSSSTGSPKDGKRKKRDKEEEEWLSAVESGRLDPELKNIKDPKLMTARQRAMVERQARGIPESPEAPSDGKSPEDDESVKALKALKSAKRKEMELEKRELDKKKTMDRLLKKRDSKRLNRSNAARTAKGPSLMTYRMGRDGSRSLSMAPGVPYPLTPSSNEPRDFKVKLCQVCGVRPKVYSCSKTRTPLCSLNCYKVNSEQLKEDTSHNSIK